MWIFFFLGLIPLCLTGPELGVMWSVLVCSREPFSSAAMACCDITGLLTAFLQWKPCLFLELLAWIDSDTEGGFLLKKQTSLMPKLCVSVSVFQHGLWGHGRCYYIMPHVFPVTFSTDSPLLSLQNILTPTSTGPPLPSLLCPSCLPHLNANRPKVHLHACPASEMMIFFLFLL